MTSFTNKAILLSFKFVNRDKSFYLLIIEFYVLVLACFSSFFTDFLSLPDNLKLNAREYSSIGGTY